MIVLREGDLSLCGHISTKMVQSLAFFNQPQIGHEPKCQVAAMTEDIFNAQNCEPDKQDSKQDSMNMSADIQINSDYVLIKPSHGSGKDNHRVKCTLIRCGMGYFINWNHGNVSSIGLPVSGVC